MAIRPRWIVIALGIACAASIACGDSAGSLSPTGLSSGRPGAVITGRISGLSSPVTTDSFAPQSTTTRVRVTINGTDISSSVDGAGQFTLTGVPPGDITLQFTAPDISATITLHDVAVDERIHIEVRLTNNTARIESVRRERDDDDDDGDEVEGRITAINPAAGTITVGTTLVNVPETARIHRDRIALTFADLKMGDEVEVHGTRNGTTFTATEVEIEDDDD